MTEDQPAPAPVTDEHVQAAIDKFAVAIARDLKINSDPDTLLVSLITQLKICAIFQSVITDELDKLGMVPETRVRERLVAQIAKETEDLMATIALPKSGPNGRKRQ